MAQANYYFNPQKCFTKLNKYRFCVSGFGFMVLKQWGLGLKLIASK
jgi:hypothetical protein